MTMEIPTPPSLPPPHLLILPQHAKPSSPSTRILTLPHPRTSVPSRYLFCPPPSSQEQQQQQQQHASSEVATSSLYEFTRITDAASPNGAGGRSWLVKTHNAGTDEKPIGGESGGRKRKRGEEVENEDDDQTCNSSSGEAGAISQEGDDNRRGKDHIIKRGSLLIATPMDPMFLLLRLLFSSLDRSPAPRRHFLPLDDILDPLTAPPEEDSASEEADAGEDGKGTGKGRAKEGKDARANWTFLLQQPAFRAELEERAAAICDTVAAGDETVYRVSERKLLQEMLRKAERMVEAGGGRMPRSMEERFIRRRLAAPVTTLLEAGEVEGKGAAAVPGPQESQGESQDSSAASAAGSTVASAGTGVTTPETGGYRDQDAGNSAVAQSKATENGLEGMVTTPTPTDEDNRIAHLLRLHTCLAYTLKSYLPSPLSTHLLSLLTSIEPGEGIPDFGPLHQHLAQLDVLRANMYAARSMSDFSRSHSFQKRSSDLLDDDDTAAAAKAKKAKVGAGESRAVRDLKKVNVSGMKKIDGFFSKKAAVGAVRRSPRKK